MCNKKNHLIIIQSQCLSYDCDEEKSCNLYSFHLLNHYFLQLRKMCAKVIWSRGSAQRSRLRLKVIQHLPAPLPPHSHRPIWGATGPNGGLGWGQKYQAWTRPVRQYCARCARWAWKQQNLPKQCVVHIYYTLLCNNVFCSVFVYPNWDKVQLNVSQERTLGGDLFLAPNHQRSGHVCHIC